MTEAILTNAIELPDHGLKIGTLFIVGKFWVGVHDGDLMRKLTPDAARGYARFLEEGVYADQMRPVITALDGVAEIVEQTEDKWSVRAGAARSEKFEAVEAGGCAPPILVSIADMPVEGHA